MRGCACPEAISKATVDQFIQQLGQPDTPELRDRIKEQLIEREVFLQEATKRGIPERPDVKFQLDFVRKTAIIQNLFRDEAKKHPVTDQQVQGLRDVGWTDAQIAEAVYDGALFNLFVRLADAFDIRPPEVMDPNGVPAAVTRADPTR